jgi:hypothetical protein
MWLEVYVLKDLVVARLWIVRASSKDILAFLNLEESELERVHRPALRFSSAFMQLPSPVWASVLSLYGGNYNIQWCYQAKPLAHWLVHNNCWISISFLLPPWKPNWKSKAAPDIQELLGPHSWTFYSVENEQVHQLSTADATTLLTVIDQDKSKAPL